MCYVDSLGAHCFFLFRFVFKVEHISNGSFSFFGIIGAATKPEGSDTPYLKTSYGWGFPDRVYINGFVYNNYGGFRVDALQQSKIIVSRKQLVAKYK